MEGYWIDKIEEHLAEMSPKILSMLSGYKPLSFNYFIEEKGIAVNNLHWTEMGNGAMRLEAELNGTPFRATFAKNLRNTLPLWKMEASRCHSRSRKSMSSGCSSQE